MTPLKKLEMNLLKRWRNMKNNSLESYAISGLKELNKHKNLSENELKFRLLSIVSTLLESKTLFPLNSDIRKLTNNLSLSRPIKDYLLRARPQVIARLITEILKMDSAQLHELITQTLLFVDKTTHFENDTKKEAKSHNTSNNAKKSENYIENLLGKYSRGGNS